MKYFNYIILALFAIVGAFIGSFWGGALFGFGAAILLLSTVGKWLLKKSIKRFDESQNLTKRLSK